MNEDYFDRRVEDFEGEPDEDMGYSPRDESATRRKSFLAFSTKILIFGGAALVLIIILIALFSGGDSEFSTKDVAAINTRVDLLENRLTRLEEVELRIASLQEQGDMLRQSLREAQTSINSLSQRVSELTKRLETQEKQVTGVKESKASEAAPEKRASLPEGRVHEVSRGENLYRISSKYGLTVDELCRLNDISRDQAIYPGQKLIIAPKSD